MELDDIPILRLIPLAVNSLKILGFLAGLILFPLLTINHALEYAAANTFARKAYEAFQTVAWFGLTAVFWYIAIGMYCGFTGNSDWIWGSGFHPSAMFDVEKSNQLACDVLLAAGTSIVGFVMASLFGYKSDLTDTFISRW